MKKYALQHLYSALLIGLFIQLYGINVRAQSKVERLDDLMNQYVGYGQFNGSVLVAEKGKVIYKKGFGMANMEWDILNESDTKHRLGSVTKQFTSMLVLQLVEKGSLRLDEYISTYLPEYPKETGDKITIHHLLNHSSGIPNYTSFPEFFREKSRDPYSPKEFVKFFSDSTLNFDPGEKFEYSNSGYFLLGTIIEEVSQKPYEEMLLENILAPLGMENTGFDHHSTILKNRASGYEMRGANYVNARYLDMSIPFSAGSLYSTVEDLYLWDRSLYTNQLLSKKYRELLFKPYISAWGGAYGYGWIMMQSPVGKSTDSVSVIAHSGGINGFNTLITRIPSEEHLIVLLNNTGGTILNEISIAIAGILYDKPFQKPKESMAYSLLSIIINDGIKDGLDHFNNFKNSDSYYLDENELNGLGYQLLQSGKLKEAIEIFKINVDQYPESGNVFDSLGEAYLMAGNKKLAIENYKKSIEIDPENKSGMRILDKLLSH